MESRLGQAGLAYTRVPAVDGGAMSAEQWAALDPKGYDFCHGKRIDPNQLGCYLSHLDALKRFIETGFEFAMILEDDAEFGPDVGEVLQALIEVGDQWDVVKLYGRHSGTPVPLRRLNGDYKLVALVTRNTGAAAYLVNRFAAARYVERLLPMRVPFDHAFDRAWLLGIRFRGITPLPMGAQSAQTMMSGSSLAANAASKKPWWRRGSVLIYRTGNETRRVWHYVSRGLVVPRVWR